MSPIQINFNMYKIIFKWGGGKGLGLFRLMILKTKINNRVYKEFQEERLK